MNQSPENVYDGMADVYAWSMAPRVDDVRFYVRRMKQEGGPVLELGMGTGRIALALARAGVEVAGVEACPDMSRKALADFNTAGLDVDIIRSDMRSFKTERSFNGAFFALNTFSMLTCETDREKTLESVHRSLQRNGLLVMDFVNPLHLSAHGPLSRSYTKDVRPMPDKGAVCQLVVTENRCPAEQRVDYRHDYVLHYPEGREDTLSHEFSLYYAYKNELVSILERTGFDVTAVNGNFEGSKYSFSSMLMVVEARKR